jgi:hypothetical protein
MELFSKRYNFITIPFVFRNATRNQILQVAAPALIARATWIHPSHIMVSFGSAFFPTTFSENLAIRRIRAL